jgi:hypothetical protein
MNNDISKTLDDYFKIIDDIIENNDYINYEIVKKQLPTLINTYYKKIINFYNVEKVFKIIYFLSNEMLYELNKRNLIILKAELKLAIFLKNNLEYLDDFDNKEILMNYLKLVNGLFNLDVIRQEYIEQNSNKGRTIFTDYKLEEINNILSNLATIMDTFVSNNNLLCKKKRFGDNSESI